MTHKNFLKIFLFFVCMGFLILGGGKALAADWYVVSVDESARVRYYQAETTSYDVNNWSSLDTSTASADNLNTFLNYTVQSGDTVYIKAGEYKLSETIYLGERHGQYYRTLHLYGGFAGTEAT